MKACAPGKLVLSGAYSVLDGAPAIVSAVERYVCCDSDQPAEFITAEVRAAVPEGPYPHFDARALRDGGRKLGLGSSAAILVASLAALEPRSTSSEQALRDAIACRAFAAHQQAQGGGSGIDVAASIWGGTLIAQRSAGGGLSLRHVRLPRELVVEVWSSGVAASTPELLAAVARFRARDEQKYLALLLPLQAAATRAADALESGDLSRLLFELDAQRAGLMALGAASEAPIVTPEVSALSRLVSAPAAAVLPSGAGGGDIVLWFSDRASPPEFRELATRLRHRELGLALHARGVHRCPAA